MSDDRRESRSESREAPTVYPPAEVARQLGLSSSGLRRLARIYEETIGELPRDDAGGRLFPEEAVRRLRGARALVEAGRAKSVAEALGSPELTTEEALEVSELPDQGAIMLAVLEELRALRSEVAELRAAGNERQLEPARTEPASAAMRSGGIWARVRRRLRELLED